MIWPVHKKLVDGVQDLPARPWSLDEVNHDLAAAASATSAETIAQNDVGLYI
jgi:hypothetical protein